jgi:ribose 5-phosphate isomerase A
MIKGGGGALLREKVVAALARRVVIVVGANKVVERLGTTFALPVEVVPFASSPVARRLAQLGCEPKVRRAQDGAEYRTDNGNAILDCAFAHGIADPEKLERDIDAIPGVVESGLFLGLAHARVVGHEDGRCEVLERA